MLKFIKEKKYVFFSVLWLCCICCWYVYYNVWLAVFYHHKSKIDNVKDKLLGSPMAIKKKDQVGLEDAVRNAKDTNEAIKMIKTYEEILKRQNKLI